MTFDDLTVQDTSPAAVIPGPRMSEPALGTPFGEAAWIEPWLYRRATRPRWQYWDVATASWTGRPPVPSPRRGD